MSDATERRIVRVSIDGDLLQDMLTVGNNFDGVSVVEGLPPKAVWVGSTFDAQRLVIELFFMHESFDPVPGGTVPPQLSIVYQRSTASE